MIADVMTKIGQEVGQTGPLYGFRDTPHPLIGGTDPRPGTGMLASLRQSMQRSAATGRASIRGFGSVEQDPRYQAVGAVRAIRKADPAEPMGALSRRMNVPGARAHEILSDIHQTNPELAQKARQTIMGGFGPERSGPSKSRFLSQEKWQAVRNMLLPGGQLTAQDARHLAVNALRGTSEIAPEARGQHPHAWELHRVFSRIREVDPDLAASMDKALTGHALRPAQVPFAPFDPTNPMYAGRARFMERVGRGVVKGAGVLGQFSQWGARPQQTAAKAPAPSASAAPAAQGGAAYRQRLMTGVVPTPKPVPQVPGLPQAAPATLPVGFGAPAPGASTFGDFRKQVPSVSSGGGIGPVKVDAARRGVDPKIAVRNEVLARLGSGMRSVSDDHAETNHNVKTVHDAWKGGAPGTIYMHPNATSMYGVPRQHLEAAGFTVAPHEYGPFVMHSDVTKTIPGQGGSALAPADAHMPMTAQHRASAVGTEQTPGYAVQAFWENFNQNPMIRSARAVSGSAGQSDSGIAGYLRDVGKRDLHTLNTFGVNQGEMMPQQAMKMLNPTTLATLQSLYGRHGVGTAASDVDRAHGELRAVLQHFAQLPA